MPIQSDYDVISGAGGDVAMGLTKGLMYQREREEKKLAEQKDMAYKKFNITLDFLKTALTSDDLETKNQGINIYNAFANSQDPKVLGFPLQPLKQFTPDIENTILDFNKAIYGSEDDYNNLANKLKANKNTISLIPVVTTARLSLLKKPDKYSTFGHPETGYSILNETTGGTKEVIKGLGRQPKETKTEDKPIGTKKAQWYIDTYPDVFEGLDINSVASLPYGEVKDMINTLSTKYTEGTNPLTGEPTKTKTYIRKGSGGNKQTPLFPDTTNTSDWLRQKGLIR